LERFSLAGAVSGYRQRQQQCTVCSASSRGELRSETAEQEIDEWKCMELEDIGAKRELGESTSYRRLKEQRRRRMMFGVGYDKNGWSDALADNLGVKSTVNWW
jgi:hypothetical protein